MHEVKLASIELDASIQCRAAIDTATVNEYAERMTAGVQFPPVVLFSAGSRNWIGDGWHRVLSASQIGALSIAAEVHDGGRAAALKHALGANATHGHKRTNADKRRCVEIALREFPNMSNRVIAEMCGVDHKTVADARPVPTGEIPQFIGKDGKRRPAKCDAPPRQPERLPAEVRVEQISALASSGHNVEQIASELQIGRQQVSKLIDAHRIPITPHARPTHGAKSGKLSADRVYEETVNALTGIAQGLNLARSRPLTIGKEAASALLAEARASLTSINAMVKKLKEIASA